MATQNEPITTAPNTAPSTTAPNITTLDPKFLKVFQDYHATQAKANSPNISPTPVSHSAGHNTSGTGIAQYVKQSEKGYLTIGTPKPIYNANYENDLKENRIKAVTNTAVKDPLSFTDSTDKQAAILARIQTIMSKSEYQALSPDRQERLRARYYDRYVAPGYQSMGIKAPDKNLWVDKITMQHISPADYYLGRNARQAVMFTAGVEQTAGQIFSGITHAGTYLDKEQSYAALGLASFFAKHSPGVDSAKVDASEAFAKSVIDRTKTKIDAMSNDTANTATFFLQTHQSKHWQDNVDSVVGEQILQLPFYEGIGGFREATAEALTKGGTKKLAERLAQSPKGMFVARRIGDAFDGYVGATLQGQSSSERAQSILAFMGLGAAQEKVAAPIIRSIASSPLIKKWMANTLSLGGKPLQQAIVDEASHQLETGTLSNGHAPDEKWFADAKKNLDELLKNDPTREQLIMGEKITLNSLAMREHGKSYRNLSQNQRAGIKIIHKTLTEDAINELPIHQAHDALEHVEMTLNQQKKTDPGFAVTVDYLEKKYRGKISGTLIDMEKNAIESQSGVRSSQGVIRKTAKVSSVLERKKQAATKQAMAEEPKRYAELQSNALAFFRDPSADRESKGLQSASTPASYYKDMSSEDFIKEVRDNLGNQWFFENPEHMMKWAYQYRNTMPPAFKKQFTKELADLDPAGNSQSWAAEAAKMHSHIKDLATTGRLYTEENVFRSSKFESGKAPTKWQKQLRKEAQAIEKKQLDTKLAPMNKNYKHQAKLASDMLDTVQQIINTNPQSND